MDTADQALDRLKKGNAAFVANKDSEQSRRHAPTETHKPYAIVVGCSDARVPAELLFDAEPGDLFIIRVAGNIVGQTQLGSIEYAAANLGTRLVVVLGHTQCGAVGATVGELMNPGGDHSDNLKSLVNEISPCVHELMTGELANDEKALAATAVRANVEQSMRLMRERSKVLDDLANNEGLKIVGAEYAIETGEVDFFKA